MEGLKRLDRWNPDDLILDEDGEPCVVSIEDSDRELFKILAPGSLSRDPWSYKYLPRNYLTKIGKRGYWSTKRIRQLIHNPKHHLRLPDQPESNYRTQIIALGDSGADELRDVGINVPHIRSARLVHTLMECLMAASFEIGADEAGVELVPFYRILESERYRRAQPHAPKNPRSIPSMLEGEEVIVKPDWQPFALNLPRGTIFLPGYEADAKTERLRGKLSDEVQSIRRKFIEYIYILENQILHQQFGAAASKVIFCTLTLSRMESMMEVLKELNPSEFVLRDILFCHMPHPTHKKPLPPTGYMLTHQYQRVDHPPFSFVQKETTNGSEARTHQGTDRAEGGSRRGA